MDLRRLKYINIAYLGNMKSIDGVNVGITQPLYDSVYIGGLVVVLSVRNEPLFHLYRFLDMTWISIIHY
jgi:hypothetical protein